MAHVVAGSEPVYRVGANGIPQQVAAGIGQAPGGQPGSTPGPLYQVNPAFGDGMQQVVSGALAHPESIPAMPTMLSMVDAYASKVPWWLVFAAGAGASWWLSGYLTKRKAAAVVAGGE